MTIAIPPTALSGAGPALERARGKLGLAVAFRGGRHAIADLSQAGCGRLLFPKVAAGAPLEAVMVNTSGGLTGGDRFETRVAVEPRAEAVLTTQACEKIYRAEGAAATVATALDVAQGAMLAWLPQETILFDRARLARRLDVTLAADARLLLSEAVLLGRRASGETFATGLFTDQWRVRQDGRLIFAEALRLDGDVAAALAHRATLAGGAAFATLLYVGPDAAERAVEGRDMVERDLINKAATEAGISSFDGLCVARLVAQDGARLRAALIAMLRVFGSVVPRVWSL